MKFCFYVNNYYPPKLTVTYTVKLGSTLSRLLQKRFKYQALCSFDWTFVLKGKIYIYYLRINFK